MNRSSLPLAGLACFYLTLSLMGCHPDNREVTVPYLSRDVSQGEVFDPMQINPGATRQVVGRGMRLGDFKKVPNAMTDIDMFDYSGYIFTRDAKQDEMITLDMLAPASSTAQTSDSS